MRASRQAPTIERVVAMTPNRVSWVNSLQGFFGKLTRRQLKLGIFEDIFVSKPASNVSCARLTRPLVLHLDC